MEAIIVLDADQLKSIQIIPVKYIEQVLKEALVWTGKEDILKKIVSRSGG